MNFTFEICRDMQFGFETAVPKPDNAAKLPCGDTELHPDGTALYAAGTTTIVEEESA